MVELGAVKAVLPVWRQLMLGVLAGVCVSLGAFLALSISGNNPALSANHPGLYRLLFGAFGCVRPAVCEYSTRPLFICCCMWPLACVSKRTDRCATHRGSLAGG